jgi:hypothetical protein
MIVIPADTMLIFPIFVRPTETLIQFPVKCVSKYKLNNKCLYCVNKPKFGMYYKLKNQTTVIYFENYSYYFRFNVTRNSC